MFVMSSLLKNHVYLVLFGVFAAIGGCMGLVAGLTGYDNYQLRTRGVKVQGEVVDMLSNSDGNTAPLVQYATRTGEVRTHASGTYSSPPTHRVGEAVWVWYDPENPDRALISGWSEWLLPIVFGGFFAIFGGIGFGGLLGQWARAQRRARLKTSGMPLELPVADVALDTSLRVGGSSPWVVRAEWLDPATNTPYTFVSDHLWHNPTVALAQHGNKVQVLIDPDNPKAYWMDTSFLADHGQ
jgi:hypothetical protein